jgi:hypothetical protein
MTNIHEEDSEKLRTVVKKILVNAGLENETKFGSVIAILMIISVVLTSIRILQECNKNRTKNMTIDEKCKAYGEEIKEFSSKRGWFTRMRIKRLLKREMDREDYEKYGLKLIESILDIGENLTDDEVQTLVENANV